MASKLEIMQEANLRGLLKGRQLEIYQEAERRGLIPSSVVAAKDDMPTGQQQSPTSVADGGGTKPLDGGDMFASARQMANASQQPMIAPEVFQGAVKNFPESTVNLVGDTLSFFQQMATNSDARQAVGNSVRGLIERAIPGEQGKEQYAQPIIDDLVKSYGSFEAAQATLRDDPARFLADAAGLLSGAGLAARGVGAAGKIGSLSRAGTALSRAGASVDPLNIAASAVTAPAALIPESLPRKIYESAIKPSTTAFRPEERARLIETGIRGRLTPDQSGLNRLYAKIGDLNAKIDKRINDLEASGKMIDKGPVSDAVYSLISEVNDFPNPETQLAALEKIEREFAALGPGALTPSQANRMKRNIYQELDYDKGLGRAPDSMTERGRKAQARALKEGLENLDPNIRELNQDLGQYLALRPIFEQGASRIANRSILGGIGLPLIVQAGASAGSPTTGVLAGLASLAADHPWLAPRVALALESARTMPAGGARVPGLTLREIGAQGERLTNNEYGR